MIFDSQLQLGVVLLLLQNNSINDAIRTKPQDRVLHLYLRRHNHLMSTVRNIKSSDVVQSQVILPIHPPNLQSAGRLPRIEILKGSDNEMLTRGIESDSFR